MKKPYIERKIEHAISRYLEKREILAIVGPRQSGKTTMLRRIQEHLAHSIFLTFEDREELEFFETDIKGFAKKYAAFHSIFIDEFQYSKVGGKHLKFLYDTYPEFKIIISGSSAIDLTIHAIRYLVGRVFVFHMYQLDFEEFLAFREPSLIRLYRGMRNDTNIALGKFSTIDLDSSQLSMFNQIFEEFILWGGYPRVALAESDEEKRTVLKNIYNTYFLRDIRDTLGIVDDFKLANLIKALSLQIGQLISYKELGMVSGYDYITLKKYLNIIEKTFICSYLRPFFSNKRSEIVKNPKVYFFDTGLRNYAAGNFQNLDLRVDSGALYENFVFLQLIKNERVIHFWRTKTQLEVDFLVENGSGEQIPIEVKSREDDLNVPGGLISYAREYSPKQSVVFVKGNVFGKRKAEHMEVYFYPHWIL